MRVGFEDGSDRDRDKKQEDLRGVQADFEEISVFGGVG